MGKIFGISNNPVSTIESALKPLRVHPPKLSCTELPKASNDVDKFVSKEKVNSSNPIIKMRNGFGKLMAHFSHPKSKV